jgi:UPF0755 protein
MLEIKPGTSTNQVVRELSNRGLIRDQLLFKAFARIRGLDRSLRAGEYALKPSMRPLEILDVLARGEVVRHRVTIPEGFTATEVAERLSGAGFGSKQRYEQLIKDPRRLFQGKVPARLAGVSSLEGFLFPDSYDLTKGETEEAILRRMVSRTLAVAGLLYDRSPLKSRYTFQQVVTMASIVEAEAVYPPERPVIAGVFYNRLGKGMFLQSCATVEYLLGTRKKILSVADTQIDSPYNTYRNAGLPPGPIGNPGRASLMAAAQPAAVNYLYFVAKGDGQHAFSVSYEQHLVAQRRFERGVIRGTKQ